jgi:hypothetical protein
MSITRQVTVCLNCETFVYEVTRHVMGGNRLLVTSWNGIIFDQHDFRSPQIHQSSNKRFERYPQILYTWSQQCFRSFLPYSKQLALVSIVTSLPLCRFCPTVNYMPWLPYLHQVKIVCDVIIVTQQCKQSQSTAEQGCRSCMDLTTLNLNHFNMVEAMGLKITASRSP